MTSCASHIRSAPPSPCCVVVSGFCTDQVLPPPNDVHVTTPASASRSAETTTCCPVTESNAIWSVSPPPGPSGVEQGRRPTGDSSSFSRSYESPWSSERQRNDWPVEKPHGPLVKTLACGRRPLPGGEQNGCGSYW